MALRQPRGSGWRDLADPRGDGLAVRALGDQPDQGNPVIAAQDLDREGGRLDRFDLDHLHRIDDPRRIDDLARDSQRAKPRRLVRGLADQGQLQTICRDLDPVLTVKHQRAVHVPGRLPLDLRDGDTGGKDRDRACNREGDQHWNERGHLHIGSIACRFGLNTVRIAKPQSKQL